MPLKPNPVLGANPGPTQQEHDSLSKIDPTVAQPRGYADCDAPRQDTTRSVDRALGREQQAEDLLGSVEGRFARARQEHPEFAGPAGLLAASIGGEAYACAEDPAPSFLAQLGLELPPAAIGLFTGENRPPVQVSLERLKVLEFDALLLGVHGNTGRVWRGSACTSSSTWPGGATI